MPLATSCSYAQPLEEYRSSGKEGAHYLEHVCIGMVGEILRCRPVRHVRRHHSKVHVVHAHYSDKRQDIRVCKLLPSEQLPSKRLRPTQASLDHARELDIQTPTFFPRAAPVTVCELFRNFTATFCLFHDARSTYPNPPRSPSPSL